MQNKANFRKSQMNVSIFSQKDYERNDIFAVPENKANSNPIKANPPAPVFTPKTNVTPEKQPQKTLFFPKSG